MNELFITNMLFNLSFRFSVLRQGNSWLKEIVGNETSPRLNGQPFVVAIAFASPVGRKLKAPSILAHVSFNDSDKLQTRQNRLPWKSIFRILVVGGIFLPRTNDGDIFWRSVWVADVSTNIYCAVFAFCNPPVHSNKLQNDHVFGTCFDICHRNIRVLIYVHYEVYQNVWFIIFIACSF